MADSRLQGERFFFLRIESICRRPAPTCPPEMKITAAAELMREQDIAALVVHDAQKPVGMLTLRDLRDLLAASPAELGTVRVLDLMSGSPVTVRPDAYVFEAIFKMAKHSIHRLAVVDDEQNLVGIVGDTDLLSLQARSPLYMSQEIELADSIEALRDINQRILDMVRYAIEAGADTRSLVQLISHFNDAMTQRIIALLEEQEGIVLPGGAAYLALGSEGRGEQTLRTDQDSALVYADGLPPEEITACARFAERLVEALAFIGVPRCPGNTMASNPEWQHSLREWQVILEHWITVPKGQHMVNFGMFQDFRTLHGDAEFEGRLHEFIYATAKRNSLFYPYVAKNIVRFPAPLGMFGRIKVERSGPDRGKVNLKKAGIFAITEGVSLLALEQNIASGTTWEKLEKLVKRGVISRRDGDVFSDAFTELVHLRLQRQLQDLAAGEAPGNAIDPMRLTEKNRNRLREALRGVNQLLRLIRDHYRLDLISR